MTTVAIAKVGRSKAELMAEALQERALRTARKVQGNPRGGLLEFIRYFWPVLEPVDPFVEGWPLECLCAHLEAITRGERVDIGGRERQLNRLLVNLPPGFMKSLTLNVFWPAWEWGPMGKPHLRYVAFSYASELTERDNAKFRDLICSDAYRELWGHVFTVVGDGKIRVTNDKTGFKFASSFGGVGTGERGHRVLLDDPHKLKGTHETDEARENVCTWVREAMQNRLNDLSRDVIVVIMQRVHELDVSGTIEKHLGAEYCHLIIPMAYESGRHFSHYKGWNGGNDPRDREGQLAWPLRFTKDGLASFIAYQYLWAGQYQQNPIPRGGGIFKDHWWQVHEVQPRLAEPARGDAPSRTTGWRFVPPVQPLFIVAGVDTAFSESEENDFSAMSVWTVYNGPDGKRRILLSDAWARRIPVLHGDWQAQKPGESDAVFRRRVMPSWGLCEHVADTCMRRGVKRLLIEKSARGTDLAKELKRLYADNDWAIQEIPVNRDKWTRAHVLVDLFTDHMIYAPAEITDDGDVKFLEWAEQMIRECASFPRAPHDDLVDSMTLALKHLRDTGWAIRKDEAAAAERARMQYKPKREPMWDV